jgi:hypothetical protein
MKKSIQSLMLVASTASLLVACGGGGGTAMISKSPSDLARGAEKKGCQVRATSAVAGGKYIVCEDEVYTAIPEDNGGAYVSCDNAGDDECAANAEALAGG